MKTKRSWNNFRPLGWSFVLCVVGLLPSCKDDPPMYIVGPKFEPYVQRFITEAAQHGLTIDFDDTGLIIEFREVFDSESSGQCSTGHHIEIQQSVWITLSDAQKEGLIFHELGHCELGRGHRNAILPNGEWASRMRGSPIPDGRNAVINYNGTRRDYYVEELFDESTPVPDWVNISANFGDHVLDTANLLVNVPEEQESFDLPLNIAPSADQQIEFEIDAGFSSSWVGLQWSGNDLENALYVVYNNAGEFFVCGGSLSWGPMFLSEDLALNDDWNKITIRKTGDKYYVFLNEEFVYWFDWIAAQSTLVRSLVSGIGSPTYRNLKVGRL